MFKFTKLIKYSEDLNIKPLKSKFIWDPKWNVMPQIWLLVLGFVFISLHGYFSIFLSPALHYSARQFASPMP